MDKLIEKNQCTGCGACELACSSGALKIRKDSLGYIYPQIDSQRCIDCGACIRACHVRTNIAVNEPAKIYAAQDKEPEVLRKSGSGGVFAELAEYVIRKSGLVYGAALDIKDSYAELRHIRIENESDISKLQGSKYGISDVAAVYTDVKSQLKQDKIVLFSGTPCQVAGLKGYLGREYDNLITVDIFCHGNSPLEIFNKYLKYLSEKYSSDVTDYCFRNKEISKGFRAKIRYANGKEQSLYTYQEGYWYLCQFSKINMEACYSCKYSSEKRIGDISLGDFWGIEEVRPELFNNGLNRKYGTSAVLINTEKGKNLFGEIAAENSKGLFLAESNIEEVRKHGAAVREPNKMPSDRDRILYMLTNEPFISVVKYSKKQLGIRYYKSIVSDMLEQVRI